MLHRENFEMVHAVITVLVFLNIFQANFVKIFDPSSE